MSNIINMINPNTLKDCNLGQDLEGNRFIRDLRSAGDNAQQSGARFESITLDILARCHNAKVGSNQPGFSIIKKPHFRCHYDLKREGDFEIRKADDPYGEDPIHIECKQLGNVESHFDKLSHCLLNLISGCYGKKFWLVYDYNREIGNKNKIIKLVDRCKKIKEQVALQGITFECILIDELPLYIEKQV